MTTSLGDAPVTADSEYFDLVIIGAGISGLGAAYRISVGNRHLTYTVLERRGAVGGTWDLFRYPGVRSDSSIFTLCFPFEPWSGKEDLAYGDDICEYLANTAHKFGITANVRFNTYIRSANWDSSTDTWALVADQGGREKVYRCRFVFFGTGFYNYDNGYTPNLPGVDQFAGTVLHPQHWPEYLDCAGKSIVVIGSGATAISMVPKLAEQASKVTMLQRSPSYIESVSRYSAFANRLRRILPSRIAHRIIRMYNTLWDAIEWLSMRTRPAAMKSKILREAIANLPAGYDVEKHCVPRHNLLEQATLYTPDGEFFEAVCSGRAEVVTDCIDHFDATGVALASGGHLDADIIVTATGLELQALGGVRISIDGVEIKPSDRFVYKARMLEDIPNLFWCVGYPPVVWTWTQRTDLTARAAAKLIAYMASKGYTHAYPHRGDLPISERPAWQFEAGYVLRSPHVLPKSSSKQPWKMPQNYLADAIAFRFDRIREAMVFGRATDPAG